MSLRRILFKNFPLKLFSLMLAGMIWFAIFSIQDIIGMSNTLPQRDAEEETINVPSNPEHYWRYRMHVSVSELAQDDELTSVLRAMIGASGRLRA